jgi:hypothetical protein
LPVGRHLLVTAISKRAEIPHGASRPPSLVSPQSGRRSIETKRGARRPEQPVPRIQTRARTLPLEDGDLLPQRQDFQGSVVPTAEENSNRRKKSKDELGHES